MNTIPTTLFAASVLMGAGATAVHAQQHTRTVPAVSETTTSATPYILPDTPANPPQSHPLFTVGRFGVYLWAPVEPPYDAAMNRSLAANPAWSN